MQKHLDEHKLPHTVDMFDFSLDDRLKRLRQIWKQFIVKADPDKISSKKLVAAKKKKVKIPTSSTADESVLSTSVDDVTAGSSSIVESAIKEKEAVVNNRLSTASNNSNSSCSSKKKPIEHLQIEPYVDPSAILPNLGVESETGQGLRCSIEKCGKLFRNDRLLQQHVKHYHPDVFDQVIATATTPVTTAPNTPATSPPSATHLSAAAAACLSTPVSSLSASDFTTTLGISSSHNMAESYKKRKSISIDMSSFNDAAVGSAESSMSTGMKKRKLSLGSLEDYDDNAEKPKKRVRGLDRSNDRMKRGRPSAKKFSFSESSAASPINNNTSELPPYDVISRTRTDSILSVDSSSVAPSEDGDHDGSTMCQHKSSSRVLPPTPPTFRLSKRRQAQLIGSSR